jgi:hypothetical protein
MLRRRRGLPGVHEGVNCWALCFVVVLIPACFHPSFDRPRCGPNGECPDGFTCRADLVCDADRSPVDAAAQSTTPGDGMASADARTSVDAMPSACAGAIVVSLGVRTAASTCDGGDHIAGCGPTGTREVVFQFTAPTAAGYTFRAFDPGTQDVRNSLRQLDSACAPVTGCVALLGTGLQAGEVAYFVVEAAAGGCAAIEFEVD